MRKTEQRVWDSMKRNMPSRMWMRRIENEVGEGEADVWIGMSGRQVWVELKAAKLPARATTRVMGDDGLRLSQINWHLKMASLGLETWVLIRDDNMQLYLLPGALADKMNDMCVADLMVHSEAADWEGIEKCLLNQ